MQPIFSRKIIINPRIILEMSRSTTNVFGAVQKNLQHVFLSGLPHSATPHVLNPIKHWCLFFKHYLNNMVYLYYMCYHFVYTYFLDFTARRFFLFFLRSSSESSPPAWLSAKATILVSLTAGSEPYSSVSVSETWSSITGSWKSN